MPEVLISFVVPAYNEEALIASCLSSIRAEVARTGCQAEIIVVDNNSTDGTRRIASSIPGVVIVDEPQRGLVQARQAGCSAANGELIANDPRAIRQNARSRGPLLHRSILPS